MSGKHRGRRIILLLLAVNVVLLGVLAVAAAPYLSAPKAQEEALTQEQLVGISDGMQGVTYNPEPILRDGKLPIMLSNGSAAGCAVRLELILLAGNTQLARTDLIDPGYRLEYLTIKRSLDRGEYPCLLRVELCTADGQTIGTAGRSLLLKVE